MRDDFSAGTKLVIAKRVGHRCSNPDCGRWTCGPRSETNRAFSLGVAAHITAAAPGGPRYDLALTTEERCSAANGIWLCHNCSSLVDNNPTAHPTELLQEWKRRGEEYAHDMLMQGI